MNKKIWLIIVIIAVIALTVAACFAISNGVFNPLEHHIKLASKYMNEGKYEEAILEFEKVIKINDKFVEVYEAKANAEILTDKEDDAVKSIAKALELIKNDTAEKSEIINPLKNILENGKNIKKRNDLLLWWYEKTYEMPEYDDIRKWFDSYFEKTFEQQLKEIRRKFEKNTKEFDKQFTQMYNDILQEYKAAEENAYYNGNFDKCPNVNSEIYASGGKPKIFYSLMDLDIKQDGIPELVIASVNGDDYNIYDIYAIDGGAKRLFDITSMGYRAKYVICNNGIIKVYSSGGADYNSVAIYEIESAYPQSVETSAAYVKYILEENSTYYEAKSPDDNRTEINKQKYDETDKQYKGKNDIKWLSLSDYTNSKEAVSTSVNDTLTEEEALELVKEYADNKELKFMVSETETTYTFQAYIDGTDKITTINYYDVDKKTRKVTPMF